MVDRAQDTASERNLFLGDALPAIRELARKLRIEVHMVEMRWGIRAQASNAHLTSEICMRELDRCLRESMGVSYIFIAGQKYGYRPFPRSIPQPLFEVLLDSTEITHEDRQLLVSWFKLDKNGIPLPGEIADAATLEWRGPPEFYGTEPGSSGLFYELQSRGKLEDKEWWPLFDRMQGAFRKAARKEFPSHTSVQALRDPENRHFVQRFFISVTEEVRPDSVPASAASLRALTSSGCAVGTATCHDNLC